MPASNLKYLIYVSLFLIMFSTSIVNADVSSRAATQCDLLAGHPNDPHKIGKGVGWDSLDIGAAMEACAAEIKRQPNNARIQFQYARVLDKQKLYEDAFVYYKKAAQQGYPAAQNSIGLAYEWGQGVGTNIRTAADWYRKAAEQDFAQAQNNLGTLYESGKGMPSDEKKAIYWFKRAAEQGYATAQRNLGVMYSSGNGVQQNHEAAFNWYLKAANQDNPSAQYNVGLSYFYGKGVSLDRQQAISWIRKAASNGNYEAEQALQQMQFKSMYCDSLKAKVGVNAGYEKLTSQKFLNVRECDG